MQTLGRVWGYLFFRKMNSVHINENDEMKWNKSIMESPIRDCIRDGERERNTVGPHNTWLISVCVIVKRRRGK